MAKIQPMRFLRLVLAGVLAIGMVVGLHAPAGAAAPTHYYVALGDSLSRGYLPGAGDTSQGYVDYLYVTLHAKDPSLQLVKLGCNGETTATMINGGKCAYPAGSQLVAAERFLAAHRADVKYLTLDIGANDVGGCAPGGSFDKACLAVGGGTITRNLNTILSRLKAADGGLPQSAGMTYYDPFLHYWLTGTQGQASAAASVVLLSGINAAETAEYTHYGFKVADVFTAFHTLDVRTINVPGFGAAPVNVTTICQLTFECDLHDIHANAAGYQLIAKTFAEQFS
jgi:lysophospholipase L1-like esterase